MHFILLKSENIQTETPDPHGFYLKQTKLPANKTDVENSVQLRPYDTADG